jgi:UPF0176 protein
MALTNPRSANADDAAIETAPFEIAAFYKFSPVADVQATQVRLKALCEAKDIRGILLVASEGLNGTISGTPANLAIAIQGIRAEKGFADLTHKTSFASKQPFKRIKVRVKKEIVTMGEPTVDPNARVGTYVEPKDWNALISDPEVIVIDTRNPFEYGVGTFKGAIDPGTQSFGGFPAFIRNNLNPLKHRKVAMFCTGGIRCEKASSFMLQEGFEEVFHLKGGILSYLENIPEEQSLWDGGCFVFDERVAVGHGLKPKPAKLCVSCDTLLTAEMMQHTGYEEGVSCPVCFGRLSESQLTSNRERMKQILLAKKRGEQHLGPKITKPNAVKTNASES